MDITESLNDEQVRALRKALTWGDQYAAKKQLGTDPNPSDVAAVAMHRRARNMGLVSADTTLEAFLDMIPVDVMESVLDERRDPTSPSTAT